MLTYEDLFVEITPDGRISTGFLGESAGDEEKNFESCKAAQVRPDKTSLAASKNNPSP